jgi:hypothetical protein
MIVRELPFPGMKVARKKIFLLLIRMKHINFWLGLIPPNCSEETFK